MNSIRLKNFRQIITLSIVLLTAVFMTSCSNSVRNAYEYNNLISEEEINATECVYRFLAAIENENPRELERIKEESIQSINRSIETLGELEKFKNSDEYRNTAIELFQAYLGIFDTEYTSIIETYKQSQYPYNETVKAEINKISEKAKNKIESGIKALRNEQYKFAEQNGLIVSEY